jgi:hypothetical protein
LSDCQYWLQQHKPQQEERNSFDATMAEMAGPAQPKGKKTREWEGSQSKFLHIFIKLER